MLFEDLSVAVTAARSAQPISLAGIPISIISADDLHYGGFMNIAEALQFAPGMDVLRVDRNRYAIGVRGLHHEYADRTLFLLNGRDAGDPFTGGVDLYRLPLFVDDISRIEIARGPGGAAWGANAFNGVVNILTKPPEDTLGVLINETVTQYGDTYTAARYGFTEGGLSMRLSFGYEQHQSSDDAITNDTFNSWDFGRRYLMDVAGSYKLGDHSKLTFGMGYANIIHGTDSFVGERGEHNTNQYTVRPFAKLEHSWDADTSGYVQWFGNFDRTDRPMTYHANVTENDLEGQYNFKAATDHSVSIGGNLRLTTIDDQFEAGGIQSPTTDLETTVGAFLIDRWQISHRFALEGQIRVDDYSQTQTDWSGRLSALYGLDEQNDHTIRLSVAKAFRAPASVIRNFVMERFALPSPPLPPDLFAYNLIKPDGLKNEETWAVEGGYNANWGHGFTTNVNLYYQRYERLIGVQSLDDPLGLGRLFYQARNIDGANAYGVEIEGALTGECGKLSLWYAYNEFKTDNVGQSIRAFAPAQNKVGLTGRWFIDETWTANGNFRYTSRTLNDATGPDANVGSTYRLDLSITACVFDGRGEFTIGVADVLDQQDRPARQIGTLDDTQTPGQTIFATMRLKF